MPIQSDDDFYMGCRSSDAQQRHSHVHAGPVTLANQLVWMRHHTRACHPASVRLHLQGCAEMFALTQHLSIFTVMLWIAAAYPYIRRQHLSIATGLKTNLEAYHRHAKHAIGLLRLPPSVACCTEHSRVFLTDASMPRCITYPWQAQNCQTVGSLLSHQSKRSSCCDAV